MKLIDKKLLESIRIFNNKTGAKIYSSGIFDDEQENELGGNDVVDQDDFSDDFSDDRITMDLTDELSGDELSGDDFDLSDDVDDFDNGDEFNAPNFDAGASDMDYENDEVVQDNEPLDADYQGDIRTVNGAYLIFKRHEPDGTFSELWCYNVGKDKESEKIIRSAILSISDARDRLNGDATSSGVS